MELTYGYLCMAKEVIARVFADRVSTGWLNQEKAEQLMAALLFGNGAAIYGLEERKG